MITEAGRQSAATEINPGLVNQEARPTPAQLPTERLRHLGQALVETTSDTIETTPANESPPLPADQRIISQINRYPAQSFSKQIMVEALAADGGQPLKPSYIKKRLTTLTSQGHIKRIGYGKYASPDHPAPVWLAPEQLSERISHLLASQPNRTWRATTVMAALDSDQSLKLDQVRTSLVYLDQIGDRVRAVGWGRYASVDYDGPSHARQPRGASQRLLDLFGQQPAQVFDPTTATEALTADGRRSVKTSTVTSSLKQLSQQELIKRVIDQNHYASLDCPLPKYQLAPLIIDRLKRLLRGNDWSFTKQTAGQALAADGGPPASLKHIQTRLRELELQGLAVQIRPGHYARPGYAPAIDCPPMITQIISYLEANPSQDWSSQDLAEFIQHPDPDKTVANDSVNVWLSQLANRGEIKRVDSGRYASRKHPAPDYIRPSQPKPQRRQPARPAKKSSPIPNRQAITKPKTRPKPRSAASQPKPRRRQPARPAKKSSPIPNRQAITKPKPRPKPRRRQSAERGRADRHDHYPIAPPPPKTPAKISIGRRIGRIADDLSGRTTPDRLIDRVEADGYGPVDRRLANELAESVLRRKGKLAS